MKKAFTLIELLVVVLIIGILSAIAVPKYQTAVNRSRYAGLMPLARGVKTAEESVYMANAAYTNQLEDLSVRVPGTINGNTATDGDVTVEVTTGSNGDYVKVSKSGLENTYVMYFENSHDNAKEIHCEALSSSERAKQLCISLGGIENGNGTGSGYTDYVLEGTVDENGEVVQPEQSVETGNCSSGNCWNGTDMDQDTYDRLKSLVEIRGYDISGFEYSNPNRLCKGDYPCVVKNSAKSYDFFENAYGGANCSWNGKFWSCIHFGGVND